MAALVNKLGPRRAAKAPSASRSRAARVSAKAARRSRADQGGEPVAGPEPAEALDEARLADPVEDGGLDEAAGDEAGAGDPVGPAPASRARPESGSYLSMYFRDMAMLDVLAPEQEFTSAREIEALEVALWETLLGHAPARAHVLGIIEPLAPDVPELRALRRGGDARAVARAARRMRRDDVDRLLVEALLLELERAELGVGPRGAPAPSLGPARAALEWRRRVRADAHAAADARNAFVKANLRLVVSIARRFNHGRMALADLIQEGNLGLIKAVERYDYRRGFRFSTYASWWIRHAISRALADKGREVRLPVHMIDAQHRLTKARRQLTGSLGRDPSTEELATATGMPADKIEKMRSWLLEQSVSIDRPVGDEEGRSLAEVLEDPDREETSPTSELEFEALTAEVRDLLGELRPIEADILRQRFGLGSEQELTLKEIGQKYNLSRERIRQLQEQALVKMRRALARRELL